MSDKGSAYIGLTPRQLRHKLAEKDEELLTYRRLTGALQTQVGSLQNDIKELRRITDEQEKERARLNTLVCNRFSAIELRDEVISGLTRLMAEDKDAIEMF